MQKPRDVFGGLIVMIIGTGFLVQSQSLDIGTASRMGPGYFPIIRYCPGSPCKKLVDAGLGI